MLTRVELLVEFNDNTTAINILPEKAPVNRFARLATPIGVTRLGANSVFPHFDTLWATSFGLQAE
jgi:hypothetical protein